MKRLREPQCDATSLRRSVKSLSTELLTVYEELNLLYSLGPQLSRLAVEDRIGGGGPS